ncbi:hypothetical protein MBANPS3_012031 [Mucor bainieri]
MVAVYSYPIISSVERAWLVVYKDNVVHGKVKTRVLNGKALTCTMTHSKDIEWLIDNVLQATGRIPVFSVSGLMDQHEFDPTAKDNAPSASTESSTPRKIVEYCAMNVDDICDANYEPAAPTLTGPQLLRQQYNIFLYIYSNFYNRTKVDCKISAPAFTEGFNNWMALHLRQPRRLEPPEEIPEE